MPLKYNTWPPNAVCLELFLSFPFYLTLLLSHGALI